MACRYGYDFAFRSGYAVAAVDQTGVLVGPKSGFPFWTCRFPSDNRESATPDFRHRRDPVFRGIRPVCVCAIVEPATRLRRRPAIAIRPASATETGAAR